VPVVQAWLSSGTKVPERRYIAKGLACTQHWSLYLYLYQSRCLHGLTPDGLAQQTGSGEEQAPLRSATAAPQVLPDLLLHAAGLTSAQ
jgi:hypothetical protein